VRIRLITQVRFFCHGKVGNAREPWLAGVAAGLLILASCSNQATKQGEANTAPKKVAPPKEAKEAETVYVFASPTLTRSRISPRSAVPAGSLLFVAIASELLTVNTALNNS